MLSSLLRPKKNRQRVEQHSPFSSLYDQSSPILARQQRLEPRHATADFTETDVEDSNTEDEEQDHGEQEEGEEEEDEHIDDGADDEDGEVETPLLPIFSAAHLG
jgi:hypothetical protein